MNSNVVKIADEITHKYVLYFVWGMNNQAWSDHSKGLALDFMTYGDGTVSNPGPMRNAVGQAIADYHVMHAARLGVTYIIWYTRIWYPDGKGWRRYTGTSDPHKNHVHASYKGIKYIAPEGSTVDLTEENLKDIAEALRGHDAYDAPDHWVAKYPDRDPHWTPATYWPSTRNAVEKILQEGREARKELAEARKDIEELRAMLVDTAKAVEDLTCYLKGQTNAVTGKKATTTKK